MAIVYIEGIPVEFIPKKEIEKRKRASRLLGSATINKDLLKSNEVNEC